jgi:hypothetical protein
VNPIYLRGTAGTTECFKGAQNGCSAYTAAAADQQRKNEVEMRK